MREQKVAKFRTRLSEYMDKHGLKRMDVVRKANVSYPTVAKWETQELETVDATTLARLLQLFGCTYEDMIYTVLDANDFDGIIPLGGNK